MAYQMERKLKDSIIEKALNASRAFKAYNAALAELQKQKNEASLAKMDELVKTKANTFLALTDGITNLDANMISELGSQCHYWLLHKPLFPKTGSEMGWDSNRADEIVDAMKSLQSAIERDGGPFKGDQERIQRIRVRVISASAVTVLCRETGIVPRNGLTPGFVETGLKRLDAKKQELFKAGDQKWEGLARAYKFVQNALNFVFKQNSHPQHQYQQPQQQPAVTIGDALPEGTGETIKDELGLNRKRGKGRNPRRSSR